MSHDSRGFSLIELMASLLVLLILMSAVFTVLSKYQTRFQAEQQGADLHQGLRGAMELLGQEIGQAGSLGFTPRLLTAARGTGAGAASVASTASIFVGQKLLVDSGANEELVTVTGVGADNFSAVFALAHANGSPVTALGTFRDGILSTSTATQLQLFGDISGDGSLVYVEYNYNIGNRTLSRSITPITAAAQNPSRILLRDLNANPGTPSTPCFQYATRTVGGVTNITEVWVTLSMRSTKEDPETKTFRTMTSSAIFSPRSVTAALDLAGFGNTDRLQPKPGGLPLLP